MTAELLATGLATEITNFGTEYGPVVLSVVGIALGLYGLKFGYAWFTNIVRVRRAANA